MAHELGFSLSQLPLTLIAERLTASAPFVHQSRTLSHHVLIYLHAGTLEVIEAGVGYALKPGSLLLLKAGVPHWGRLPSSPGLCWSYVHFVLPQPGRPASPPLPLPVRRQEFAPGDYDRSLTLPKRLELSPDGGALEKLERLVALFGSVNPLRAAYLNPLLMELLLDLYAQAHPPSLSLDDPVSAALMVLEGQLTAPFRSQALARACGISYNYLCGLFKARTGLSPSAYHARLRMSEAARLLRETQLTVSEISDRFGFCNPQYFSRSFSSVYSASPRAYRRRFMRG